MEVRGSPLRPVFWTAFLTFFNLLPPSQECIMGNPSIEPPSLVVKYGAPATATCSTPFHVDVIGWNAAVGNRTEENAQTLVWSVDNVTDWSLTSGIMCFTSSEEHGQCQTHLPITIYKIPDRVILKLPLLPIEGRKYPLICDVHRASPFANLTVRWFRGYKEIGRDTKPTIWDDTKVEAPTGRYFHFINVSAEDHGSTYFCSATLDATEYLSNFVRVEVLYRPRVINASEDVSLKPEARLELICEGDGNPSPSYLWKRNGEVLLYEIKTTLSIESVDASHAGVYECILSNIQGNTTVSIKVDVEVPTSPVTGVLVTAVLVLATIGIATCWIYHKNTKTDRYHLRQLSAKSKSVVATTALQEKETVMST